jgi:DNA-binding NarL/FixJ family response regulator
MGVCAVEKCNNVPTGEGVWMPFKRKILIVEDDEFIGSLMVGALKNEGFESVLAATSLIAKRTVQVFDPDMVIVDIDLGDGPTGIEFIQMLCRSRPDIAGIVLSKHADAESAGVPSSHIPDGVAYLRKSLVHDTTALVSAIEETLRGHSGLVRHDKQGKGSLDLLTKSQRTILHLMALGLSNKEIATRRGVSLSSIEQRISEIFKAFGITKEGSVVPRVEAIRRYIAEAGLPER